VGGQSRHLYRLALAGEHRQGDVVENRKPVEQVDDLEAASDSCLGGVSSLRSFYVIDEAILAIAATVEFQSRANAIFNPMDKSLAERLGQGLGWMTRGRQTVDRAERFFFCFTAIEALLSDDDKAAPVVQTIARHAAVILQHDPQKRAKLASEIRSHYEARSALVHKGKRNVSQFAVNTIQNIVEALYKTVIEAIPIETSFSAFHKSLSDASYGLPWPPSKV
jgi:Apea-like HEPN